MTTPQDVRAYVRSYLDLEVDDLSDALIDTWSFEGFRRIIRARQAWPAYEATTSFTTDGATDYAIPHREVRAVFDNEYGPLMMEDFSTAQRRYRAWTGGGRPRGYSVWANRLHLWPAAVAGRTYIVSGYRTPIDPRTGGAGATFDLPHEDAADILVSWVMHKAYLQQDEPELAQLHKAEFDEGLAILSKDETDAPTGVPVVLNGARRTPGLGDRLAFPFE